MAFAAHPRVWFERRRARSQADYWIAHGFESHYPARVEELASARERKRTARSLAHVIGEVQGRKLPGAAPLQRAALRPCLELLERIHRRLLDGRPVTGIGMLAVQTLLTSPDSCLYTPTVDVEAHLLRIHTKLEAH
jgi:hypothetical protein